MTALVNPVVNMLTNWRKRRAYRLTVQELRAMPHSLARDVNILPGDIERVARQAVYGA